MAKYRTEKDGKQITIWNDTEGIGLRFTEGETLQKYNSQIVVADAHRTGTEEGVADVTQITQDLTRYAEEQYPKEFAPLAD
jgi:hypothetical protein